MNSVPHFFNGIQLVPQNTISPSSLGDVRYNSSSNKIELYRGSLDSLVTEAGTATLTNKILSGNTATNFINGSGTLNLNSSGTITVPNATDTLVGKATTDTLSNKTLNNTNIITVKDNNLTIQDNADTTKQLQFELSSITTATTRTLTAPDANTTLLGTDATQTITNKTINAPDNTITNISDVNISSSAAIAYTKLALTNHLVDADINASAAISRSKLAALTANRAMVTNGSGFDTVATTTATEIGFVSGVTSPIQAQINGITVVSAPPGMMTMFGGTSVPTGWLFCDGSVVAQSGLYANLFTAIGSTWNTGGEGAGNFRLPNTQGLFPRGAGTQTVAGKSYTASLAGLAADRIQGHFHAINDPTHAHGVSETPHHHGEGSFSNAGVATGIAIMNNVGANIQEFQTAGQITGLGIIAGVTGVVVQAATNDGTHGTPNIDFETAPAAFGINFMIKY